MMHREHIPREITPGKVGSEEASTLKSFSSNWSFSVFKENKLTSYAQITLTEGQQKTEKSYILICKYFKMQLSQETFT